MKNTWIRLLVPLFLFTSACATTSPAARAPEAAAPERPFGTLREQATRQQAWLCERMDKAVPALMRQYGIEMWVVPMREYNEDPTFPASRSASTRT